VVLTFRRLIGIDFACSDCGETLAHDYKEVIDLERNNQTTMRLGSSWHVKKDRRIVCIECRWRSDLRHFRKYWKTDSAASSAIRFVPFNLDSRTGVGSAHVGIPGMLFFNYMRARNDIPQIPRTKSELLAYFQADPEWVALRVVEGVMWTKPLTLQQE
jgi:hypothetical protein